MSSNKKNGGVRKSYCIRNRIDRSKVLKVLAAVMEQNSGPIDPDDEKSNDCHNDFFNTGRIGRRNALPDILGRNSTTSTADLPLQLSALSTNDPPDETGGPSCSTQQPNVTKTPTNVPIETAPGTSRNS